uniref:Uncharacterized protein n=1 Tax=Oryza sativa subsp. japonica TaxID=39947 RepID=Q7XI18_ORYSJ|nr:hypothetical protein [Oryza sativa Japonica Group]
MAPRFVRTLYTDEVYQRISAVFHTFPSAYEKYTGLAPRVEPTPPSQQGCAPDGPYPFHFHFPHSTGRSAAVPNRTRSADGLPPVENDVSRRSATALPTPPQGETMEGPVGKRGVSGIFSPNIRRRRGTAGEWSPTYVALLLLVHL